MIGALHTPHTMRLPGRVPGPPAWAGGYGADAFGVFADLVIGRQRQRMRWIEPGRFVMGSPESEPGRFDHEGPRHEVHVRHGYWIGDSPVTQGLYREVTGHNPSRFQEGEAREAEQRPVEQVSWDDARAFCQVVNATLPRGCEDRVGLPSEARWEYAARAGSGSGLYTGEELTSTTGKCAVLDRLAWYDENSGNATHPVRGKAPNAWGLYDTLGNVWEWCQDPWHSTYEGAPGDDRAWGDDRADGAAWRVVRGGGWYDIARYCRCACRSHDEPGNRGRYLGFRVLLAPSSTGREGVSREAGPAGSRAQARSAAPAEPG